MCTNRTNKNGGGVGIYVAKQLKCKIRKDLAYYKY